MKRILLPIFLIGTFIALPSDTSAQNSGIAISPLVFEITGNQGETINNQVKITNNSQNRTEITISIEDIAPEDEEGHVRVEAAETETYSIARWVTTDPGVFVLEPGEAKWVLFSIKIPQNAEPGGHYGTVVAAVTALSGSDVTGAAVIPRVAALILVSIPGAVTEQINIEEFSSPVYSEKGPINFLIRYENEGTVHVKPKGTITITNWLGKKVTEIPVAEKNILPGAIRRVDASWDAEWILGLKYTATLTGTYGTNNKQLVSSVISFWVFPWKLGIVLLVVLVLIFLGRNRLLTALRIILKGR